MIHNTINPKKLVTLECQFSRMTEVTSTFYKFLSAGTLKFESSGNTTLRYALISKPFSKWQSIFLLISFSN